jgi:plastocyanin
LRPTTLAAALIAALLLLPATALAIDYPPPANPKPSGKAPKGPHKTRTVCKQHGCKFHTIQKAVNASRAGDTVKVKRGTYREGVQVKGAKKRFLRIVGDVKHPSRVKLDGKHLHGIPAQNGIKVDGANNVTIRGFKARHYKSNGFFVVNVNGYTLRNLIAEQTGVYGIYAFNSVGGLMADSEAYYANDGAFYIGQTPVQAKPIRSIVRNVSGWGSTIGFSGTNMRYVTITKSRFYNNALGIVPNALDSEKYPPEEDNAIVDNDIFWNNFNFHKGAPFPQPNPTATGALAPIGTGIVLLGGRGNLVANNRFFGNFLGGVALLDGILIQDPKNAGAISLDNNQVVDNTFGAGGTDVNGHDIVYDGSGSNNCFNGNTFSAPNFPTNAARFPACPFTGSNALSNADRSQMLKWIGEGALAGWNQHAHPAFEGIKPLEVYTGKGATKASKASAYAAATRKRTVHLGDDFFSPHKLTVRKGTKVTWRWPSFENSGNVHDVKLVSAPKGFKKFHSESAASDLSISRKLTKKGKYLLVCTFHDGMDETIRVK